MTIAIDDRGFTLGDGLFETVLAQSGRLELWDEHVARLMRGCETLGLPAPQEDRLRRAALATLRLEGLEGVRAAVRISWTAGGGGRGLDRPQAVSPTLVVQASAAPAASMNARLVTVSIRRNETSPASRLKTLSYLDNIAARREALAAGGTEALMLNSRGVIAGAAAANIFWIKAGVLHTPSLDCGVLDGIMRGRVIAASPMPVAEVQIGREALEGAEAVFLTNSLIGLQAVTTLDGHAVAGAELVEAVRRSLS